MADFRLLNYSLLQRPDDVRPGILVREDSIVDLRRALPDTPWAVSTLSALNAWDEALPALHDLANAPGSTVALNDARLHAPLLYPLAIYCAAANYNDHAKEMSAEGKGVDKSTVQPYIFLKSGAHCVVGPNDTVGLPRVTNQLDWEGELAVVIGRRTRNASAQDAMACVAGYTLLNDLSARDLGRRPDWPRLASDWFAHKNFDGAAPMGPWITPADQIADHTSCRLQLWVNEEKKQDSLVDNLIFKVPELIEYISRRMTLLPGDVIATGTPAGVGRPKGTFLKTGDTVRLSISGLGTIENRIVQGE